MSDEAIIAPKTQTAADGIDEVQRLGFYSHIKGLVEPLISSGNLKLF
jgi:hypothetical protein